MRPYKDRKIAKNFQKKLNFSICKKTHYDTGFEPSTFGVNSLDAYALDYESNVKIILNFNIKKKLFCFK